MTRQGNPRVPHAPHLTYRQSLLGNGSVAYILKEMGKVEKVADGSGAARGGLPEGWIHGLSNTHVYEWFNLPGVLRHDIEQTLNRGQETFVSAMLNVLEPGGRLAPHVDGEPYNIARWHLPLMTNPDARYWDDLISLNKSAGAKSIHLGYTQWYGYIPFWLPHAVWNDGPEPRIHLVVDFATRSSKPKFFDYYGKGVASA